MAYVCALSGEIPEVPAISTISKSLFEKRLLEKWVREYGTDPITKESMSLDDIVELKLGAVGKPRAPSVTSIPQLLQLLQDEWDSTVLYTHQLAQSLSSTKKELYTALYQKDAASRVIARQLHELSTLEKAVEAGGGRVSVEEPMSIDPPVPEVLSKEDLNEKIQSNAKVLISNRKKIAKSVPEGLTSQNTLSEFHQVYHNNSLHSPREGKIYALDLKSSNELVVTAGADKKFVLFDRTSEKIVKKVKAHSKRINQVQFHPNEVSIVGCSLDHNISIWNYAAESDAESLAKMKIHTSSVIGIDVHPYNSLLLSGEHNYKWCLSDLNRLEVVREASLPEPTTMGAIHCHPDGLIFAATNTNSSGEKIFIWDVCSSQNVAKFSGEDGAIESVRFSENGYHFVALQKNSDGCFISLWDLRKLKAVKSVPVDSSLDACSIAFDQTGSYLAVGGNGFMIFNTKTWDSVISLEISKAQIQSLKFGESASSLATVGLDKNLRFFSA